MKYPLPHVARKFSTREKLILSGLYLSKFDTIGMKRLGFSSFTEAFNVIGFALSSKPASIKNYRDEFDPSFPNTRRGWHKRPMREYCKEIYDTYKNVPLGDFAELIRTLVYSNDELDVLRESLNPTYPLAEPDNGYENSFAKRLITGQAAENYFENKYLDFTEFRGYKLENTTRLGCGFDFKLIHETKSEFLAVEVKGLNLASGVISLTPKEYAVASRLNQRYFLAVVKNFNDAPFCDIHRNPLNSELDFRKTERTVVQINWSVAL